MAVSIRLSRQGSKKNPQYLIVAVDSAKKRDGAYLAHLGHYYPKALTAKDKVKVNLEAIRFWQARGAQCSQTVAQLLKVLTPSAPAL